MKKFICVFISVFALLCVLTACGSLNGGNTPGTEKEEDVVEVIDGYVVVNGVKTEYKVESEEDTTPDPPKADEITVVDGYLVVNGVKTGHKVYTAPVVTVVDGYLVVNGESTGYKVDKEDIIVVTVVDGYVVVNGVKTEHKVQTEPIVSVIDGYVAVNGVKTEYEVNKADVITVEDGYVVVNGEKTEHKVQTEPIVSVIDGYVAVNGVKTEYKVAYDCDHAWKTLTTAPTCTTVGFDIMTCSLCDKSIKINETEKIDHDFVMEYTIDDEYHWYKCNHCTATNEKELHSLDNDWICTSCWYSVPYTPDVRYRVSDDGTYAMVVGYDGTSTKVKIASEYNGLPVKSINGAFNGSWKITSVKIPDSVTSIGEGAFIGCTSLSSVVIPDSVTSIGDYAFEYCTSLSSVVIGDSVTSIGEGAFSGCTSLSSVVIGDSVTSIGSYAFEYCTSLSSVVISDSVTSIGYRAFYGCTSLSSVVIPDSVESIGKNAFSDCHSSLYAEYEFGKYVRSGDNPYAVLIEITNKNMSTYTINENTKHIANEAFSYCSSLTSITIPDSVTSIGDFAFWCCDILSFVVIGDSVTSIGANAFTSISLTSVYISDIAAWCNISFDDYASNPMYFGASLYLNGELVTELIIPDIVTSIGNYAFYSCDSLSFVVIPDSVTSIGDYAFFGCSSLRDVHYTGSAEEWAAISIGFDNYYLTSATRHYNYIPE